MWEHHQSSSQHDNKQLGIGRGFLCCAAVRVPEEALVGAAFVHPRRMQGRSPCYFARKENKVSFGSGFRACGIVRRRPQNLVRFLERHVSNGRTTITPSASRT